MKKLQLFVDSGAFSAWGIGKHIDLHRYADALLRWQREIPGRIQVAANLDVIPGRPGTTPSPSDIEAAAKQSFKNYATLKRALAGSGLVPLPVFHRGERLYWLEKMIGDGATYLGLGAIAKTPSAVRDRYVASVFKHVPPEVGVHGFGVTSNILLRRHPWRSVDSTSWLVSAGARRILIPIEDGSLYPLAVGKTMQLGPERLAALKIAFQKIGMPEVSLEELSQNYAQRFRVNLLAFAWAYRDIPGRVYFGTGGSFDARAFAWVMDAARARARLVSFGDLGEKRGHKRLVDYVLAAEESMSKPAPPAPETKQRKREVRGFFS